MRHFVDQPLRRCAAASVAQKTENIHQTRTGKNPLITYVAEADAKIVKQLHFKRISRSEVSVAAFAGENIVAHAVPVHPSLAQSGACGDDSLIANRFSADLIERDHILGVERGNAPRIGFKIVDQESFLDLEFVGQALGFDDPWKIGGFYPAVADWTCNAEACGVGTKVRGIDKFGHDLVQSGIFAAGENGSGNQIEAAIHDIKECQSRVGASDVACQNHFSKSLHRRLSRSSNSSASLGPQVPAA